MSSVPPPPPPPAPSSFKALARIPTPPAVPAQGPTGAYLVELFIFDGRPFADHWAYFVHSHTDSAIGAYIQATGDVNNGFELEVKRGYNIELPDNRPSKAILLQWVAGGSFDEMATFHEAAELVEGTPRCQFERSAFKVKAPGKSLNSAATSGQKIIQRNCQTWIVESAKQLVEDGIFAKEVGEFLGAIKQ